MFWWGHVVVCLCADANFDLFPIVTGDFHEFCLSVDFRKRRLKVYDVLEKMTVDNTHVWPKMQWIFKLEIENVGVKKNKLTDSEANI